MPTEKAISELRNDIRRLLIDDLRRFTEEGDELECRVNLSILKTKSCILVVNSYVGERMHGLVVEIDGDNSCANHSPHEELARITLDHISSGEEMATALVDALLEKVRFEF